MEYLGLDIWMEILSRVGVKDLIRLKSVSKTFLDLISSLISKDDFIRLHLDKSSFRAIRHNRCMFICLKQHGEEVQSSFRTININGVIYRDYFKQYGGEEVDGMGTMCCVESYGSSNGLVCLWPQDQNKYGGGVLLWNPALCEAEFIPIKRPQQPVYASWFGYDNDGYKLILWTADSHIHLIRLYIDTNSWKSSYNINNKNYDHGDSMGTLVHRTVHWPAYYVHDDGDEEPTIISYDIRSETAGTIATPDGITNSKPYTLGQVDGCLATVFCKDSNLELWVMKEYGVQESWTKLMNFPLGIRKTYRNSKLHSVVEFDDPAQLNSPIYGKDFYVESLISPKSIKTKMC